MVTAGQLQQADPGQIRYVAGVYRVAAASVASRCDELDRVTRGLSVSWSGPAQAGALAALAGVRGRLVDATEALTSADQALAELAEALAVAQNGMSGGTGPVGRALRMADAADADSARRLDSAVDWFAAMTEPAYVPGIGTDPAMVAQWWKGLDAASQRYLIVNRPEDVTRLDGIPADARDEAARLLLRSQRSALSTLDTSSMPAATAARVRGELDGLDKIAAALDDPYVTSRTYLLGVDAADNRAIFSVGDPDQASDVVTMVPGVGSGLPHIAATLDASDNITATAAAKATGFTDVATVGWLDYDAPPTVQQAASAGAAHAATAGLARFDEGIRVTHAGATAHDTLLGYSYGSTVVGMTAHSAAVSADDIVFVGSPGVGVNHAADLGIDPSHVWATVSRSDPIQLAIDPVARAEAALTGHSSSAMWYGTAPTSRDFGGQRFASNPGSLADPLDAHLSYFDDGTASLLNIADIALGLQPAD
jgi:uncharacterized protein YukE